jgi:hypothetical protein
VSGVKYTGGYGLQMVAEEEPGEFEGVASRGMSAGHHGNPRGETSLVRA